MKKDSVAAEREAAGGVGFDSRGRELPRHTKTTASRLGLPVLLGFFARDF